MNNTDKEYFRLLNTILERGRVKKNRTGIDTIGVFGEQAKYDVDLNAFPILTTKKVFFKAIVHELLWFISGSTNIKYLVDNDVHIWDEWAYARFKKTASPEMQAVFSSRQMFIDQIKSNKPNELFAQTWGELGEGTYGSMWRAFPHFKQTYKTPNNTGVGDEYDLEPVDQLQKVIDKLKTNPDDRRMIVSAWHPYWVDHCALPPCHCLFHFNTEELTELERFNIAVNNHNLNSSETAGWLSHRRKWLGDELNRLGVPTRKLNCLLYQRSLDLPIGGPFNITSYCLLTAMIAQCVNMEPGVFTWSAGDMHIYVNQLPMVKEQLSRTPKVLPKLWLNPDIKNIFDFKFEDIKLIGYDPHPAIKMPVAV